MLSSLLFGRPERAAARGATFLDETGGPRWRWYDRVDLDRLDMRSGLDCVLGQLFADFGIALAVLRLAGGSAPYGFSTVGNRRYRALTDAWRAEILRRRADNILVADHDDRVLTTV